MENAGNGQEREAVLEIQPAEYVTRKQREFSFLPAIRPAAAAPVKRQELLEASVLRHQGDKLLTA